MKEIEGNVNIWKHILYSWIKRIKIAKIKILPKTIYRFNANPIKITNGICHRTKTYNTEICMNTPKTLKSQNNLEEEEQTWCITFPDFKLYYKAIVIKMVWYQHKNRHIDQWYRKELSNEPTPLWSIDLWHGGGKKTQWGKDRFLSKWSWVTQIATCIETK